jgi:PKHD-type hydroxylase
MLILIENLLPPNIVNLLRDWMTSAVFEDGRATAGGNAALVKNNEQVSSDPDHPEPRLKEMQDLILDRLWEHPLFCAAAQPKEIKAPLFSRYATGKSYGLHMDNAMMGESRVDVSLTIFLDEPTAYEGGELVMYFPTGERSIKLPAGHCVLYPTTALHRVAEVTRGTRLVAVSWVRSLVRDAAKREILFDLKLASQRIADKLGKTPEIDMLNKTHTNLLRQWVED